MTTTSRSNRLDAVARIAATLPTPSLSALLAYGQDDDWPAWPADEIVPGLFQGGTADQAVISRPAPRRTASSSDYDVVVTLYADAQPAPWGVEEVRYGFYDAALSGADAARVIRAARYAHQRWLDGDRVLIRCQAGLNRSGLVTALVLVMAGLTPGQAIALIRARRSSYALCNTDFVTWLVTHGTTAAAAARTTWPSATPAHTQVA